MYLAHTEFFKDWSRECNQYSLHYEYVLKLGNARLIFYELLGATTVGTGGDWSPQLLGWRDQQLPPPQLLGRSF